MSNWNNFVRVTPLLPIPAHRHRAAAPTHSYLRAGVFHALLFLAVVVEVVVLFLVGVADYLSVGPEESNQT